MGALLYSKENKNNRSELITENKEIKERLNNLGSLITSMENFEIDRQQNPAFKDIIDEIQKVLKKYEVEKTTKPK